MKIGSWRSNSVTRQVTFNRAKIGGKCQNSNILMRHFEWFSSIVEYHFLKRYWQVVMAGATKVFQIYILGDQRVESRGEENCWWVRDLLLFQATYFKPSYQKLTKFFSPKISKTVIFTEFPRTFPKCQKVRENSNSTNPVVNIAFLIFFVL